MSDDDLIVEEDIESVVPQATDAKARATAKSIITKAVIESSNHLEYREQKERMLLGLWYSAMNILIDCMNVDDTLFVLSSKIQQIVGTADNALSPPRVVSEKAMEAYKSSIFEAGRTITECLDKASEELEEKDLDELYPETVLDVVVVVLLKAWGPDHLRRAIQEQSAFLLQGHLQPAIFMEPMKYVTPVTPNTLKPVAPTASPVEPAAPIVNKAPAYSVEYIQAETFVLKRKPDNERTVFGFIASDTSSKGMNGWACWVTSTSDDRSEETLNSGIIQDYSGHSGWVYALHEALTVICSKANFAKGIIEVSSKDFMKAVNAHPTMRANHHEDLWRDIDAAVEHNQLEFRYVPLSLSKNYMERCDMKIRNILAGD